MICEKCGREYPDTLPQPIRCFCNNRPQKNKELVKISRQKEDSFRRMWKELHTYTYINSEEAEKWLLKWSNKIPCGECKIHWLLLINNFKPDFSSKDSFFEWGVKVHNLVNKKLGKTELSIEQAKVVWGYL